jgi:hypothetical protein
MKSNPIRRNIRKHIIVYISCKQGTSLKYSGAGVSLTFFDVALVPVRHIATKAYQISAKNHYVFFPQNKYVESPGYYSQFPRMKHSGMKIFIYFTSKILFMMQHSISLRLSLFKWFLVHFFPL